MASTELSETVIKEWIVEGSSDVSTLDDLTDVVMTSPADNEVLSYDTGTTKWINQTAAEAGLSESGHDHTGTYAPAANGVTNGDAHNHIGGDGAAIAEGALAFTDVTTANVTTSLHGLCPKAPNDKEKYLRGDATWAVPSALYVPASVTVNAGTPAGGVGVSQVQTPLDGNVYEVAEVAATPGFDIDFGFTSVLNFHTIVIRCRYDGADTHYVGIDIHNHNTANDDQFSIIHHTAGYYEWYTISGITDTNYISGGVVTVRLYHYSAGNASHDLFIDYVALIGWC